MPETNPIDQILDKLARDVESSIHAFYRGDVRQHTQRVKTDTFVREARQAITTLLGASPVQAEAGAGPAYSPDEVAALMRCVMGWQPMGVPTAATPDSRCVPAAREMAPSWGEREKARLALRRT